MVSGEIVSRRPEDQWTSLDPPEEAWDRPLARPYRMWNWILWIFNLLLAAFTFSWLLLGQQNTAWLYRRTSPEAIQHEVESFVEKFEAEPGSGVVAVPPGEDAYLVARQWSFYPPILKLQAGHEYTVWYSSADVYHNPIIAEQKHTFTSVPGYKYGIRITPQEPGEYLIYCAEYCGLGHQNMISKLVIEP
ncbi:MAG: hypothetical protein GWN58_21060 [Anaerolineae bacterium]|nr:hypothetical protein [Anaerolineae bacterium]